MSKRVSSRSDRSQGVFWGLILVIVGGWALLRALGIALLGIGQLWPIFPVLGGLGIFVEWLRSSHKEAEYGSMIPATIGVLVGLFFFGFTLGFFEWGDMGHLWPVFPLIVGIAFLVAWVFSLFREWGLLIPAGVTLTVGVVGLSYTLEEFENIPLDWVLTYWPIAVIGIGVIVLLSALFGVRRAPSPPAAEEGLESYEPSAPDQPEAPPAETAEAQVYKREGES